MLPRASQALKRAPSARRCARTPPVRTRHQLRNRHQWATRRSSSNARRQNQPAPIGAREWRAALPRALPRLGRGPPERHPDRPRDRARNALPWEGARSSSGPRELIPDGRRQCKAQGISDVPKITPPTHPAPWRPSPLDERLSARHSLWRQHKVHLSKVCAKTKNSRAVLVMTCAHPPTKLRSVARRSSTKRPA